MPVLRAWAVSLGALSWLLPAAACAEGLDAQVSSRLALGGGAAFERAGGPLDDEALFELGARVDALIGDDRPARVRLGPELEVRTAGFESVELAVGPALLLPLAGDFTVGVAALAGYAFRLPRALAPARDGAVLAATLRLGYQPYDHYDPYAMGLHLYVSGRLGPLEPERWEVLGGVEVDLELLFVTPVRALAMALSAHDPDEPGEAAP